jgi:hypothetical protein
LLIGGSRALEAVTGERFKEGRGRSQGKWRHRRLAGPATAWRCQCHMQQDVYAACTCTFGACTSRFWLWRSGDGDVNHARSSDRTVLVLYL